MTATAKSNPVNEIVGTVHPLMRGRRGHTWLLAIAVLILLATPLLAQERAPNPAADEAYKRGLALQNERRTLEAIPQYEEALRLDPFHAKAHWEIGWSYWVLGKWPDVVRHWEVAAELGLVEPELEEYLQQARDQLAGKLEPLVRAAIGTRAEAPAAGGQPALRIELVARFQHYDPTPEHPADRFDQYVFSPKSVHFVAGRAYVNALEGFSTIVYDPATLERRKVIRHVFGAGDARLFAGDAGDAAGPMWSDFPANFPAAQRNRFSGKPVEFAETHGGRYLWVSYYRRDHDKNGVFPSAVALIDTARDMLVRVISTGPIPKFLAASPDGRWLAVIHWGDNTVGLLDVSGDDPRQFRRAALVTVGSRLTLDGAEEVDRDRYCGFCLRGAVFTADSRQLLVGRMGGGGIAVIDVAPAEGPPKTIGTVQGMKPTPRQLAISADGERLYVGSNVSGYVSLYRPADLVSAAANGRKTLAPLRETQTGSGTRTIALSPDGKLVYAAVNNGSKLVVLDAVTLNKRLEIVSDSYPVGLAVSPDGTQVWLTSQGRKLRGGNSITVYRVAQGPFER